MKISKLVFLACPSFLTLVLVAPNSAQAQEAIVQTNNAVKSLSHPPLVDIVFDRPAPKLSISRLKATPSNDDVPTLDFTDAESETAIQKYGCDCSGCIIAVQQLQGKLPL
jgi:hypothetical protein